MPIASVTLARLYAQQDHLGRAREMLDRLLAERPDDGVALELRRRLDVRVTPTLSLTTGRAKGSVRVRWRGVPIGSGGGKGEDVEGAVHVIVVTHGRDPAGTPFVSSCPCTKPHGERRIPCGPNPGSASACIAVVPPAGAPRPIAVAAPLVWDSPGPDERPGALC